MDKDVTDFTIPEGVIQIGESAFQDCTSLKSVSIPDSVTSIGDFAFYGCTSLKSISIPDSVTDIGWRAFFGCTNLTSVTIMNANIDIDDNAFEGCPDSITFHTPCKSAVTEWAESKGYQVEEIHTPVTDPAVAPTCAGTGLTEGSHCSACGKILTEQKVVPKLISIKKCTITVNDAAYTGKAVKPEPAVKYKGKKLVKDTDYTVSYKNNRKIGTATVTVAGKGKYGESVSETFKINPKPVKLSSLKPGSKKLTVKWKKGSNITGYQVQYSLKSDFSSSGKITITKARAVQTVIKKLKANKTYYVRVRTYKTVNDKKYYSTWSKAKSAKVKK